MGEGQGHVSWWTSGWLYINISQSGRYRLPRTLLESDHRERERETVKYLKVEVAENLKFADKSISGNHPLGAAISPQSCFRRRALMDRLTLI